MSEVRAHYRISGVYKVEEWAPVPPPHPGGSQGEDRVRVYTQGSLECLPDITLKL